MKSWTVYKHISPSGKVYIGISSNVKRRWAANGYYYHLSDTVFSRALKKYGWENFQHIILQENLTKKEACNMEKELITYHKAKGISYNITDGGEGYTGKHTEEHNKHKIEARLTNSTSDYLVIDREFNYVICKTEREVTEYLNGQQRNISHVLRQPVGYTFRKHYIWKHRKGTPVDIEFIRNQIQNALILRHQKMSENSKLTGKRGKDVLRKTMQAMSSEERKIKYGHGGMKGHHHSEETKRKISQAAKGRDMSKAIAASKQVSKKEVIQVIDNLEVNRFESVREASRILGINPANISACLNGRRKTAGGYSWKFKKEMEVQYVS